MVSCLRFSMWSDRESNPDLIFRRDLFYPLNYQTIVRLRCAIQPYHSGAKVLRFSELCKKKARFPVFFLHFCIFALSCTEIT